jgi:threonine dehydrogenase-like Zn-dependent dehydrogenase
MRAVKMLGAKKMELREFPRPNAKGDWVVLKVECCAMCGSDLNCFYRPSNDKAFNNNRFIPGHEISGIVEEVDKAERVKVGDRVSVYPFIGCDSCFACKHGLWRDCKDMQVIGFGLHGGHAEYVLVPERNLHKIPDDITFETAALVWDGIGASYGAIKRLNVKGPDIVAVLGCGPIGLGAINNSKFFGARVIAVDPLGDRLDTAKMVGADHLVNPTDANAEREIMSITAGFGPDVCIECSGREPALHQALRIVRHGGRVGLVGELGEVQKVNFSDEIIHRDLTLAGSLCYDFDKMDELIGHIRKGLRVEKILTHTFTLEESEKAWDLFDRGKTGKVIIAP